MERIKLDLVPGGCKPILHASQYDDGRQWWIDLLNNGIPYILQEGDVVEYLIRKGDGLVVTGSIAYIPGATYVILVSTEQMCAVFGSNLGELKISSNGAEIGTGNFILDVEKATTGGEKSKSVIWDLQAQVDACTQKALENIGAKGLPFDNEDTNLEATNTENAIKEVNEKVDEKADSDSVYTKEQVDQLIDDLPEAMIFKGTLGVGGTITALPTASAENEGYTYKVITAGIYAGQSADVGDMFTSNGSEWVLIPAGDEDSYTREEADDKFATQTALEEVEETLQSDLDKLAVFGEYNPHSFLLESNLYADGGLNLTYTDDGLVANNPLPVANRTATFNVLNVGVDEVVTFSFDIDGVIPIKIVDVTTQAAYFDANSVSGKNTITFKTTGGSIGFRFTVPYTKSQITISNAVYTKASETSPTVIKTEVLPNLVKDAANAFKEPITYNQLIDYENINKYKTMSYSYGVTTYNDFVDSDYLFASNLIAVSTDDVISLNQKPEYIFLYRSTGISQGRVSGSSLVIGDSGGYEYTIPSNVSNVIIVYLVSNNEELLCEFADKYDSDDDPLNYGYVSAKLKDSYYNESTIKELVGNVIPTEYNGNEITVFKKGICVGDSLTKGVFNTSPSDAYTDESRSYPTILSRMMNTPITNAGIGGATTSDWYDAYGSTDLSGHDFAIIQLGVNDSLSPSGWDEASNTALSNIISKLKTDNPNIKIFVATIVPAPAYHNYKQYKASEAIKAFVQNAEDEDVILVDIAKYGHELQSDAYSAQHLTAIGYQRLARDYFSMISKYISDHLDEFKWVQFIGTNNAWHT